MLLYLIRIAFGLFWSWLLKMREGKERGLDETITSTWIVWPDYLDMNFHMNNSYYHFFMENGRFDWSVRTGILAKMNKHKFYTVLAGVSYQFRRELGPFQRFYIKTKLLGFKDRWVFFEHTFFTMKGQFVGRGIARLAFLHHKQKGSLQALEVFSTLIGEKEAQALDLAHKKDELWRVQSFDEHQNSLKESS